VFIDPTGDSGELELETPDPYAGDQGFDSLGGFDYGVGASETAIVDTDDGGHLAFADTDHDGEADLMTVIGSDGQIASQSRLDAATGEWVALRMDPGAMSVDASLGADAGVATVDSDGDGRADTFVTTSAAGDTLLYTDVDGDGRADVEGLITADGTITRSEHTGAGEWTQVETGQIAADGTYHADPAGDPGDDRHWAGHSGPDSAGPDVVRTDPDTGEWISRG
jgi:hypothetical protein